MPNPYNDYPLDVIKASMQRHVDAGAVTFFKWTCIGCGDRVTANQSNVVLTKAKHEDCGVITDCEAQGGNFLIVAAIRK